MDEAVYRLYNYFGQYPGLQLSGLIEVRAADDAVFHVDIVPCGNVCDKCPAKGTVIRGVYAAAVIAEYVSFYPFKLVRDRRIAFAVALVEAGIGDGGDQKAL